MFEVGFSELLLIMGIALIVLGPEKLPGLVSRIGRWMGRARAMARQFREQLEVEAAEASRPPPPAAPPVASSAAAPVDEPVGTPSSAPPPSPVEDYVSRNGPDEPRPS
jgi:Tat protein translocase TatB subunit